MLRPVIGLNMDRGQRFQPGISPVECGAILAILGSVERAELLINRIDAERKSVNRAGVLAKINAASERQGLKGYPVAPAPCQLSSRHLVVRGTAVIKMDQAAG